MPAKHIRNDLNDTHIYSRLNYCLLEWGTLSQAESNKLKSIATCLYNDTHQRETYTTNFIYVQDN